MKISVVVPVYNEEATIRSLLLSFTRLDYPQPDLEVIIVDNGSEDHTRQIVSQFPYRLLVESNKQTSYAARNLGISHSNGDVVAFTDGDCVVSPSWLSDLAKGFDNRKVGGVAGPIIPFDPTTLVERLQAWLSVPNHNVSGGSYPLAIAGNVAYRREVFEKVGLFDETFPSDVDLALRMQKEGGFSLRFLTGSGIVFHRNERNLYDLMVRAKTYGYGHYLLSRKHPSCFVDEDYVRLIKKAAVRTALELRSAEDLSDFFLKAFFEFMRVIWQVCYEAGAMAGRRKRMTGESAGHSF